MGFFLGLVMDTAVKFLSLYVSPLHIYWHTNPSPMFGFGSIDSKENPRLSEDFDINQCDVPQRDLLLFSSL